MEEYYTFDLSELKQEIAKMLETKTDKLTNDKDNKLKEIADSLKRIKNLAQDHISKGSQYRVNELDEQQTIEEFES